MSQEIEYSLRPVAPEDSQFIYQLLLQTMREYVVATGGAWDEEKIRAESAQNAFSPHARVLLISNQPSGLMTIQHRSDHIDLDQLYLLPDYQRMGIGTRLIQGLLAEASARNRPVRLSVLRVNPARRFYERLGFIVKKETPERVYMEFPLSCNNPGCIAVFG